MINILIIVLIALILLYAVYMISKNKKCNSIKNETECQADKTITEAMMKNSNAYIVLINKKLHVIKSNFYTASSGVKSKDAVLLGEIIKLDNDELSSDHMLVKDSNIRKAVEESYSSTSDFINVQDKIVIYLSDNKVNKVHCYVEVSGSHVTIDGEDMVLLTMYDISKFKKGFNELSEQKNDIEELFRQKAAFLSSMGHDIRTPINSIIGFSDLLNSAESVEEREDFVKIISGNSYILLQMVNDIIDLAKIEAQLMKLSYAEIDARAILKELEDNSQINCDSNEDLEIVYVRNSETVLFVADKNRVMQVLLNFVTYSMKNADSGQISYGYRIQRNNIYFYVKNTGSKINAENKYKVFDGFSQFCENPNADTNIGLSICKTLITMMGGEIGVDFEENKVSTFWFTLPL